MASLAYHFHTVFLFTASDFKTIVIPSTAFGILGSYAYLTEDSSMLEGTPIQRIHLVFIWTWLNLLPFNISNQRHPAAIQEDRKNKPWRPLPSRRLTSSQANILMLGSYLVAFIYSMCVRGMKSCLTLIALGWWYNDRNGAERCWTRNLINAAGYISFTYGAVEVAIGSQAHLSEKACQWFLLIGMIIFSTVQVQDIPDQEGDNARGRRTIPLVIGDTLARWSVAVLLPIWSLIAASFWQLDNTIILLPLSLALLIAVRLLRTRSVADDMTSFKFWNMWVLTLYTLPLWRRASD